MFTTVSIAGNAEHGLGGRGGLGTRGGTSVIPISHTFLRAVFLDLELTSSQNLFRFSGFFFVLHFCTFFSGLSGVGLKAPGAPGWAFWSVKLESHFRRFLPTRLLASP